MKKTNSTTPTITHLPSYNTFSKPLSSPYTPTKHQVSNIRSNFSPSQRHSVNFMFDNITTSPSNLGPNGRSDSCGPEFRTNPQHRNYLN
jgi:hypothetical protein